MADEKISDLPAATTVADADLATVVQSGTNKKSALSVIKTYIQTAFTSVFVALTRTLTIGGSAKTLAADRSWTTNDILEGLGSPAQGDIIYRGASNWVLLTPGTSGNVLSTNGAGANPSWTANASGDFSSNTSTSVDSEIVVFSGTTGKLGKRATGTGVAKITSGVLSTASAGTDYEVPLTFTQSVSRSTNTVTLTGDSATPGNSKYYGTNVSGTRGFYDLPPSSDSVARVCTIGITIDGSGGVISTGVKGYIHVPYGGTINQAVILCDQSGSIVINVWKCTYTQFDAGSTHPVVGDKITSTNPPTVTTATKSKDSTLTGWTTSFSADDVFAFNVDSVTTVTRATLILKITKS